jgi:elongation factor G
MLYLTGAVDRQGKVTDGNTVCDYDPRKPGVSSASPWLWPVEFGGCKINVLDCPGYLTSRARCWGCPCGDAGIIFCTAKRRISVGAERSWKVLKQENLPCMFYVSKCDEEHGD